MSAKPGQALIIRGPLMGRISGAPMMLFAPIFATVLISGDGVLSSLPMLIWSLALSVYGVRLMRVAVIVTPTHVIVRNRFRTAVVPRSGATVSLEKRRPMVPFVISLVYDRWVGVLRAPLSGGDIEILAIESYKMPLYGYLYADSKQRANEKMAMLQNALSSATAGHVDD